MATTKPSALDDLLKNSRDGRLLSASTVVAQKPNLAALISKLRATVNPIERELERSKGTYYQDRGQIEKLSAGIKSSVQDNENIMKLFPDMWLAEQILVSSIMSPKDMLEDSITFKPSETLFPSSVQAELTNLVTSYFNSYYSFKEQAPDIISNALFRKGAHIKVILPENILDEVINGHSSLATEAMNLVFRRDSNNSLSVVGKGFLGDTPVNKNKSISWAIEQMMGSVERTTAYTNTKVLHGGVAVAPNLLDVVDNYDLLKIPLVQAARSGQLVSESIYRINNDNPSGNGHGLVHKTSGDKLTHDQFKNTVFKNNSLRQQTMITISDPDNAKRRSISRPLVMDAPTECCIPVCRPGRPQSPVGAFFLIDVDGNFVSKNSMTSHMDTLSTLISGNNTANSMSSMLTERIGKDLISNNKLTTIDHISKFYSTTVQSNLIEKLRNGRYQATLDVNLTQEVSEIMLARVLCDQYTRIVYIPAELFTYFAFEFEDNGVGKSYLDEVKMLTSIRGILLFSKVMGMVKNSINVSSVKVKLDPKDPNPEGTIEESVDLIYKMRQQFFPIGINSTPELADWVTKAGLEIGFEGHPGVPDVGFEFENKKSDHNLPDNDLDQLLRDHTFMRFGITSEMIDGASQPEFASTIQQNNILFSRRIRILQNKFCKLATDFVQKVMRYDPIFRKDVIDVLIKNEASIMERLSDEAKELRDKDVEQFLNHFFDMFVMNTEVMLPAPDDIKQKTDKDLIEEQSDAYDKMIEFFINSEFAPSEIVGEWSGSMDMLKVAFKAFLMRRWASNNNILPEMFEVISNNEDGHPQINLSDEYSKIFTALSKSFIDFSKKFKPLKLATAIDLQRLEDATQEQTDDATDLQNESLQAGNNDNAE